MKRIGSPHRIRIMNLLVSDGDLLVNGYLLQSSQLTRSERDRRRAKREIGERGCRDFVPLCDWPILRDLAAEEPRAQKGYTPTTFAYVAGSNPQLDAAIRVGGESLLSMARSDHKKKEQAPRGACRFKRHQYSDGRSNVVALRSASVMIQILVPSERQTKVTERRMEGVFSALAPVVQYPPARPDARRAARHPRRNMPAALRTAETGTFRVGGGGTRRDGEFHAAPVLVWQLGSSAHRSSSVGPRLLGSAPAQGPQVRRRPQLTKRAP